MNEWVVAWLEECMDAWWLCSWRNAWVNGWLRSWRDAWMHECFDI